MSHYAKVLDGKVTLVIVADAAYFETFVDSGPGTWVKTSYTQSDPSDKKALRGNYAGVGYTYDQLNDVFYAPKPYPSWTLNALWAWESPVQHPNDGQAYDWDEAELNWAPSVFMTMKKRGK